MYAHPHVYTRTQVRAARCPPAPVAASSRRPRPRDVCAPRLSPVIGLAAGGATRTARGGLVLGSVGWREGGASPPDLHGRGPVSRVPPRGHCRRYAVSWPTARRRHRGRRRRDDRDRHFIARVHEARTLL